MQAETTNDKPVLGPWRIYRAAETRDDGVYGCFVPLCITNGVKLGHYWDGKQIDSFDRLQDVLNLLPMYALEYGMRVDVKIQAKPVSGGPFRWDYTFHVDDHELLPQLLKHEGMTETDAETLTSRLMGWMAECRAATRQDNQSEI